MATQTATKRRAAARKAAATRKRNAARRDARRTARRFTPAGLERVQRQAERALLIPVGATLAAGDAIADAVTTRSRFRRQLSRFERRGATAVRRGRGRIERRARATRRDTRRGVGQLQSDVAGLVDRVQRLSASR